MTFVWLKEDILSSTFFRYENLSTFLSAQWKYYPLHSLIVRKINVLQFNRNCVRSTSSKGLLDILMSTLVLFCIATVISFIAIGCKSSSLEVLRCHTIRPNQIFPIQVFILVKKYHEFFYRLKRKTSSFYSNVFSYDNLRNCY